MVTDAIIAAAVIALSTCAIRWVYWTQYVEAAKSKRPALVALHFCSVVATVTAYLWVWLAAFREGAPARTAVGLAIFAFGSFVFFWSAVVHRTSLVPDDDASLTDVGPYRFVRHPIYAGGLLAALGLLVAAPDPLLAGDWIVLLVSMLALIRSEERELQRRLPSYAQYMKRIPGLVPLRLFSAR